MTRLLLLFISFVALQGCDALFAVDAFVCDPSGGPLAGARVSVHYASSGAERTSCTTDASGQCKASTVTGAGRFTVVVSAAGFKNSVITVPTSTASRLESRSHLSLPLKPVEPNSFRAGSGLAKHNHAPNPGVQWTRCARH